MKTFGITLVVVGVLMMVFSRINFSTKEKVADIGPLEINKEKEHSVGWPIYVGGVVVLAGVVMTVAGKQRIK
ncbi:MAG: hypothetical protein EOP51_05355 [Sphingobacteriales bacterium]|nr:MAG: hypothetical protein EOP51_05355 [Sphingobacteriales bacterium]